MKAVVSGGGISGLTAAWWLAQQGVDVSVLERNASVGGTMRTLRDDGWLVETGPNSALETTPLFREMFSALGIQDQVVYASPGAKKRYIVRDGNLHPLPLSPAAFFRTSLWTTSGKLRLLKEPFVGRADHEESIAQFVERRLGKEFLDYAINPFVAGVFAGDPAQLSVRAAFPKLYALEERYGGLIKGMIRGRRERKQRAEKAKDRAEMFSFVDGMQSFPLALAASLGDRVRTNCTVEKVDVRKSNGSGHGAFDVTFRENGRSSTVEADVVIVSTPADVAAGVIRPHASFLASQLEKIYYPPVTGVFLGFADGTFAQPLDGFGYLVPEKEGRTILGTIWSSSLFPHRAPAGYAGLTTFVGGSRQPDIALMEDTALVSAVTAEIHSLLHGSGQPAFSRVIRWNRAIPQYTLGHRNIVLGIEKLEAEIPGLFLCSNYRGGISVGDCVMSAKAIAVRAGEYLRSRSAPTGVVR
jgi:protoporphyrinogen/coproporphyrinogen III oxidase